MNSNTLHIAHFEYEGKHYQLREPLIVDLDHLDGFWVFSNTEINLWGCAARREDALRALAANFDYLWREFAMEEDSTLDEKAQDIKRTLLQLVESISKESEQ